jgi:AcrR family transcriptional regulator
MSTSKPATTPRYGSRQRTPRPGTRQQLLAAAGEIFADKGVDAATGQEICHRAGVNSAAINYYFGGMEGLYEAVLLEAISHCPSPEADLATAAESNDPRQLLRAIIGPLISILTSSPPDAWVIRLLMREFISPSPASERLLLDAQALPQALLHKTIVAQIMGLPVDHPAVAQGCICVLAPLQIMVVGQQTLLDRIYPEIDVGPASGETLVERALAFALGGLEALAKVEAGRPK